MALFLFSFSTSLLAADGPVEVSPAVNAALTQISANSLRGHVSFLASDLLEGRGTPSRGLDIAAEYIASQFRRAGLEAPIDGGYFQVASFLSLEPNRDGLRFETSTGVRIDAAKLTPDTSVGLSLTAAAAVKFGEGVTVNGKVVLVHAGDFRAFMGVRRQLMSAKPTLIVVTGAAASRMRSRNMLIPADEKGSGVPIVAIQDEAFDALVQSAPAGDLPFTVTVNIGVPIDKPVTLRNVIGVLRGSDPALKDTFELVTAHYDHLGTRAEGTDKIFNGANDDASGTASVIEIATALAGLNPRPRRSIVFLALFGEEVGLLGSRYYGVHPVFPIARTVADVNLEHMGRTDSGEGSHAGLLNFTGFDFSTLPASFRRAGEAVGIQVVKDEKNSDAFFGRSDNQALADLGVPAHTASVTYEFPDYHQVGDEWSKIDYDNMARVDRAVALGMLIIANSTEAPQWNASEPKTARYVEAAKKLAPANPTTPASRN